MGTSIDAFIIDATPGIAQFTINKCEISFQG